MGLQQFNVSVGESTRLIHIQESAGVDELFRKVSADCANNVDPQDIMLVFGDVQLDCNQNKSFRDYGLVHMSTMTLLVQLRGGANPGSNSMSTQGATNPKQPVVKLYQIKKWTEFYDSHKEELKKCLHANGNARRQEREYTIDPEINSKVSLFEGDIASLQVGVIVSSDGSDLTATGGVSRRIRTVAGLKLENDTKAITGIRAGEVIVTPGGDLPAKHVVHTVGPQKEEPKILESCYKNCLEKTKTLSVNSLAFPCIATGSYEYPREKAVLVALRTVRVWLEEQKQKQKLDQIARIIFCLFTPEDVVLYKTWMQVFYPCQAAPHMSRELLPLPGFIETTTTEPDMIGVDEEGAVLAKMPCGHVIGPLSMTDYCKNILAEGRYRFCCPDKTCKREWEYFLVRHVARFNPRKMQDIEKQIAENYLNKANRTQKCPGCQTWCYRASDTDRCVRCKICNVNGKPFDFCWWCLNPWRASSADQPCGNAGCDGKDTRLNVLETCPTKQINHCSDCPSIRGCPKCGMLIEHKDKCAQVDCTTCGDYGFCFICLAEKKNGKWQCSWSGTCTPAPRQTTLPGSK